MPIELDPTSPPFSLPAISEHNSSIDSDKHRKRKARLTNGSKLPQANMSNSNSSLTSPEINKIHPNYNKIEEINTKLRQSFALDSESNVTLSEPTAAPIGKRSTSRDALARKKLEDERQALINQALRDDPNFKPPPEPKKTPKLQEKYFIPAKEHPEINFIGLLIGPRGNTLKRMESESGTKISIRGKGSVKEGKRSDASIASGNEEELHCLISGDSVHKIARAKKLIEEIIETSSSVPEGQNELKRQQLRELAALNGTLRDDENQPCGHCGYVGHRKFDCPELKAAALQSICAACSLTGHLAPVCPSVHGFFPRETAAQREQQLSNDILSLVDDTEESSPFLSERLPTSNPVPLGLIDTNLPPSWSTGLPVTNSADWSKVPPLSSFSTSPLTFPLSNLDSGFTPPVTSLWNGAMSTPFSDQPSQLGMSFMFNSVSAPLASTFKAQSTSEAFVLPDPPSHPPPSPPPPPSTDEPVLPWVSLNGTSPPEEQCLEL